ncbi:GntR family transcriptional regulator [Balneatrix alpica]|uniref:GntR family transcriptional regulator n=1 Tax=Balneatrix alpica TaxID=75684 RepID=A0ABV5ZGJ7_9GAMM|nr:GntR family transcriptional regulator [Balneatrix alpica]
MTEHSANPLKGPEFQPLYQQVQQLILKQIVEGHWRPGEALPSEFQLADQFGVSQGTVRKALNALTDDRVLFRRQGVGTFVSEHTLQQTLFHFFHFVADGGTPELPHAQLQKCSLVEADAYQSAQLQLTPGSLLIRLDRIRILRGRPCIREQIFLPEALFSGLADLAELPHSLYHFYQHQYGITVHKAIDRIKAALADAADSQVLDLQQGEPILLVERVARSLDGRPVEFRISRTCSQKLHYLVELN